MFMWSFGALSTVDQHQEWLPQHYIGRLLAQLGGLPELHIEDWIAYWNLTKATKYGHRYIYGVHHIGSLSKVPQQQTRRVRPERACCTVPLTALGPASDEDIAGLSRRRLKNLRLRDDVL